MNDDRKKLPLLIILIIVIVLGGGIGIYLAMSGGEDTNTNTATTNTTTTKTNQAATNSETDPYADLMQYDDKTIDITSDDGKVTGQIAISIDLTEEYPINVVTFMKVDDPLPQTTAATGGTGYYYIANHAKEEYIRFGDGTGALSEAMCNPEATLDVLDLAQRRTIDSDIYLGCDAQTDPWHVTEVFYHIYASYYNNETWDYKNDVIGKDTLAVFDSAPFYEEEEIEGYQSWGADDEIVIRDGEIVASYDLIYTE